MVFFRGQKKVGHAQVGLLKGFNLKFPTSIPAPFISLWESPTPRVKNIHIVWHWATSLAVWHVTKNSKNPDREAPLVAIFPILPLYFIVFHLKRKYYEDF